MGALWAGLFFAANFFDVGGTPVGDVLGFFGQSLFFPIALVFAGRVISRRARRPSVEEAPDAPEPKPQQRPAQRTPPPPTRRPAPPPPVAEPEIEKLEEAIGFSEPMSRPETTTQQPSHMPKSSDEMIAEARERFKTKE